MLILEDNHHAIFMHKRPPAGIWGGLWCFPQFDDFVSANDWTQKHLAIKLDSAHAFPLLTHTFSHFRLHIQALIINCETPLKVGVMETDESLWYNINTEFNGGLAAPVQQLINQVKEFQNGKNG
jgi:A/G-specific adenine glycosylase